MNGTRIAGSDGIQDRERRKRQGKMIQTTILNGVSTNGKRCAYAREGMNNGEGHGVAPYEPRRTRLEGMGSESRGDGAVQKGNAGGLHPSVGVSEGRQKFRCIRHR